MIHLFVYSATVLERKHGPVGYTTYHRFKPWLRDEFSFRCAYCLFRETWFPDGHEAFGVDHLNPKSQDPDQLLVYDNMVYACNRCNRCKGAKQLQVDNRQFQPFALPVGNYIRVEQDESIDEFGFVVAIPSDPMESKKVIALIQALGLNSPLRVRWRRAMLRLAEIGHKSPDRTDVLALCRSMFGYPDIVPDLDADPPPRSSRKFERDDGRRGDEELFWST